MFGGALDRAGARPRPHRLPRDPGREPVRVERQPHDRARLPGPPRARSAPAAVGSWSSTRAARRRPRRPTSTCSSGPAPTRTSCSRSCTCSSPRASCDLGACGRPRDRPRRGRAARARRSRPRPSRRSAASTPTTIRRIAARPRDAPSAPRSTAASARAPRSSARSRRGSSTCVNILTGNLDREGGTMFTAARRTNGRDDPAARPAGGRGVRFGRRTQPGARAARVLRRATRWRARRRDRDPGRRPDPGDGHRRRATRCVSTPDAGRLDRGARRRSTSWCRSTSTATRPPGTPT